MIINLIKLFKYIFLPIAIVDGIKFYSQKSLSEYLLKKERNAKGIKRYDVSNLTPYEAGDIICMLESKNCFDYNITYRKDGFINMTYYSNKILTERNG